jgi:hypothetical protein
MKNRVGFIFSGTHFNYDNQLNFFDDSTMELSLVINAGIPTVKSKYGRAFVFIASCPAGRTTKLISLPFGKQDYFPQLWDLTSGQNAPKFSTAEK